MGQIVKLVLTIGFFISPFAFAEEHRPFSEMKGGCENYAKDLKHEFSIWENPIPVISQRSEKESSTLLVDHLVRLELFPQAEVKLIATPEKTFPVEKTAYSGMSTFSVSKAGLYRVSVGKKLWLDLVDADTKQSIKANSFEMQTGCSKILKTIEFKLDAQKKYVLQVSSSPDQKIDVLATQAN